MFFRKKCEVCNGHAKIRAKVPVYGYTAPRTRHFCSMDHLDAYLQVTALKMKTRKACIPCTLR